MIIPGKACRNQKRIILPRNSFLAVVRPKRSLGAVLKLFPPSFYIFDPGLIPPDIIYIFPARARCDPLLFFHLARIVPILEISDDEGQKSNTSRGRRASLIKIIQQQAQLPLAGPSDFAFLSLARHVAAPRRFIT